MSEEKTVVSPSVQIPSVAPSTPSAASYASAAESKEPAAVQPANFLSELRRAIQTFLSIVQSDVQQRPPHLKPSTLLISYVPERPDATAAVENASPNTQLIEQAVQTLAGYLSQAGIRVELMPFSTLKAFNEQLAAHDDPSLAILCTKTYATVVEATPGMREAIAIFGRNRMDALHTLLYEGGFRDTAFKIVDSHYLVRACQPLLQSKDSLTVLENIIDVLLHPSGNAGLGLLPDLLDLEQDAFSNERAAYQNAFNQLQVQQQRLTIAYRLQQGLYVAHQAHPFQSYFQIQEVMPSEAQQAVDGLLRNPTTKTALLLCKTSADTLLTGLSLEKALIHQGITVISIECADYSGKAASHCVDQALQKLKLHRRDRAALSQGALEQPVVILFKGYEQLGCYDNLYVKNALRRWKNVNVLVTCRADYFQHRGYENCFLSDPTNPNPDTLITYIVPSFASKEAQAFALSPALQEATEARQKAQAAEQISQQEMLPHPKLQAEQKEFTAFLEAQNHILVAKGLLKETLADNPAVFISYAWERGDALVRLQTHLRRIVHDLTTLGFPTWLDVERMTGDIDEQMAGNIERSAYALVIDTPLYRERAAIPTNVRKEYEAITAKKAQQKLEVVALQLVQAPLLPFETLDFTAIDEGVVYIRQLNSLITQLLHLQGQDLADYQEAVQALGQRLTLLPGKHLLVDRGQDDVQAFDIDSRLKDHIPAHGLKRLEDPFETRFDLKQNFAAFLQQSTKTYVLLGLAGSGKSLFTLSVFKEHLQQWHQWKAGAAPQPEFLPIYIPLRSYANEKAEDCITSALREYGLDEVDIENLRTGMSCGQKLLFILDGFDELGAGVLPNYPQKLADWPTAKLFISGRPQQFEENGRATFADDPQERNLSKAQQTFTINHLSPFSSEEIENYVQGFNPETAAQNYQTLKALPGLMPLLDNPFLLNLTLQALPRLLRARTNSTQAVKRSDIYQAFIETIFNKESAKQGTDNQAVYHRFAQNLAFALFTARQTSVTPALTDIWQKFFADAGQVSIREACPLKRTGDAYTFIHKSVYEYFVAVHLWDALGQAPEIRNAVWNQRLLTEEPAVIDFLAEFYARKRSFNVAPIKGAAETKDEEKHGEAKAEDAASALWAIVEASKHNPASAVAAASVVTVLNTARVSFTGRDLSHTHLMGADLSNSVCDTTDFSFSDLSGVNFTAAWLSNANFTHANLQDLEFGELPYIALEARAGRCAYAPDGRLLAVATGKTIALYDIDTHKLVEILEGHTEVVTSIAFSPDSTLLASGSGRDSYDESNDNTVRLWSVKTGKCEKTLEGHNKRVASVTFSPDGQWLVSGSDDNTMCLWSVETGLCEKIFKNSISISYNSGDKLAAFSPDGQRLVSVWGTTLRLWSIATGQCEKTLEGHISGVTNVAFSPDGMQLASSSDEKDKTLRLWSVETGQCEKILEGHTDCVTSIAFSQNRGHLVSGSKDKTLRLWSVETGKCERVLEGHTGEVTSVAFSPDSQQLVSCGGDALRLWLIETTFCAKHLEGHTEEVQSVAFSPNGQWLASGSGAFRHKTLGVENTTTSSGFTDDTICLWSVETGACEKTLKGHTNKVTSVAFSPNNRQLASCGWDRTLRLWSVETGQCEKILNDPDAIWVAAVAFSPDGQQLASGSDRGDLRLWSVKTGICEKILKGHTGYVTSLAFSPDNQRLASGSWDKTLGLWLVETGQCEKTIKCSISSVGDKSIAFSPDGQQLAFADPDKTLRVWSVEIGQYEKILENNLGDIIGISFSPDGQILAASDWDNMLRLWLLQPGLEPVQTCQRVSARANSLSWSQKDGALFLASGHDDASVRYWQCHMVDNLPTLQLLWTSKQNALFTNNARLDNAHNLSPTHFDLLKQHGAKVDLVGATPLYVAALNGDLEAVERLLENNPDSKPLSKLADAREVQGGSARRSGTYAGVFEDSSTEPTKKFPAAVAFGKRSSVNDPEANGITPLAIAAKNGHLGIVQLLLSRRANTDVADKNGLTPLHMAALNGHIEVVHALLAADANPCAIDEDSATPLHLAAQNGHASVIQTLLAGGADLNAAKRNGATALYIAAENDRLEAVQALLAREADVNAAKRDSTTPLYIAAEKNHPGVIQALLAGNADVDAANDDGVTPLSIAVKNRNLDAIRILLAGGANINAADNNKVTPLYIAVENNQFEAIEILLAKGANASSVTKSGSTALYIAADRGRLEVVQALLASGGGANIDVANKYGFTPLDAAVRNGHLEVVQALLAGGANANAANKDGATPLYIAADRGHFEVVQALLAGGANANVTDKEGFPLLYIAAYLNRLGMVEALLAGGASANAVNRNGFTSLHIAAENGHLDVVQALLDRGANINAVCEGGFTALYVAAENGHLEVVQALLARGADINTVCGGGFTALYIAAENGRLEIVQALLARGANANVTDKDGFPLLYVVSQNGHLEVVQALLARGADINAACEGGFTALYVASQNGHLSVVEALLAEGAGIDAADKYGCTPLHRAVQCGHLTVVQTLLAAGGNPNSGNAALTPLVIATWEGHGEIVKTLLEGGADNPGHVDSLYAIAEKGHHAIVQLMLAGSIAIAASVMNGFLILAAEDGELETVSALLTGSAEINTATADGTTSLCIAAEMGHTEVVKALIAAGADINLANKDGTTPLAIATEKGHDAIVELLEGKASSSRMESADPTKLAYKEELEQKNEEPAQFQMAEESHATASVSSMEEATQENLAYKATEALRSPSRSSPGMFYTKKSKEGVSTITRSEYTRLTGLIIPVSSNFGVVVSDEKAEIDSVEDSFTVQTR